MSSYRFDLEDASDMSSYRFDLEDAIAAWRRTFEHNRAFCSEDIEELEGGPEDRVESAEQKTARFPSGRQGIEPSGTAYGI